MNLVDRIKIGFFDGLCRRILAMEFRRSRKIDKTTCVDTDLQPRTNLRTTDHILRSTGPRDGFQRQIQQFYPLIEHECLCFLKQTLAKLYDLMPHLRKLAGGIIVRLTYGYQVQDDEDPFLNSIEKANTNFNAATVPGAFIVDFFPIFQSGFLVLASCRLRVFGPKIQLQWKWYRTNDSPLQPKNLTFTFQAAGNAVPSFVSTALADENSLSHEDIEDLKFTASFMYGALQARKLNEIYATRALGTGVDLSWNVFRQSFAFACIATSLAVFNIDKVGATGVPIVKVCFS
ncbi:hypothetical protein BYT27DRAFT_7238742 [Phlegmacium glaucopus]|nr:hypothetical protein BYT27DRAFT_7238742 [Phlegmacium glaucopus]